MKEAYLIAACRGFHGASVLLPHVTARRQGETITTAVANPINPRWANQESHLRLSNPSSKTPGAATVVAMILVIATQTFGQTGKRPSEGEPVTKTQPAASGAASNQAPPKKEDPQDQAIKLETLS